jgi:hypothetical protein
MFPKMAITSVGDVLRHRTHVSTLAAAQVHNSSTSACVASSTAAFAAAAAAAALSLIMLALGAGLGLTAVWSWSQAGMGAPMFGVSTILWLTLTQLLASGTYAYLADRLRTRRLSEQCDVATQHKGLTEPDAEKRVNEIYVRALGQLRDAQFAEKQAADTARKTSACAALWMFISLLVGEFLASWSATMGSRRRDVLTAVSAAQLVSSARH